MKISKLFKMRSKLKAIGYRKAHREFLGELIKIKEEHKKGLLLLEKEKQSSLESQTRNHIESLRNLEESYKREINSIQKHSDNINERLESKIEKLDQTLRVRDDEITRLRQITEQAMIEEARRSLISDRVLKEASLLHKTDNELRALQQEAEMVSRKTAKRLKLVR